MKDGFDPLTATAADVAQWLAEVSHDFHGYVEARAMDLAEPIIAEARRRADADVAAANASNGHLESVLAEVRRQLDTSIRIRDGLLTDLRNRQATPGAYPTRPLTPEQERSVSDGEARTDWPLWRLPCDPAITIDGATTWLSCTDDDRADSESPTPIRTVEPGDRWSELVADIATHRCQTVDHTAGQVV